LVWLDKTLAKILAWIFGFDSKEYGTYIMAKLGGERNHETKNKRKREKD
jgi:hypothetical protein